MSKLLTPDATPLQRKAWEAGFDQGVDHAIKHTRVLCAAASTPPDGLDAFLDWAEYESQKRAADLGAKYEGWFTDGYEVGWESRKLTEQHASARRQAERDLIRQRAEEIRQHARDIAEERRQAVAKYACGDCGSPAGRECKPEYGCRSSSRCVLVCDVCGSGAAEHAEDGTLLGCVDCGYEA